MLGVLMGKVELWAARRVLAWAKARTSCQGGVDCSAAAAEAV